METVTRIARKQWNKLLALAAAGNSDAQCELGSYHESGAKDMSGKVLTDANPKEAFKWYRLSATQGNSEGQDALSNLLSSGDGIERDFPAAIHWAKKAIAQGEARSAFNLGTIYRDLGKLKLAFHWYCRAADMGDADAFVDIGLCYLFGVGTKQDQKLALSFFQRAADGGAACTQHDREIALYWMAVVGLLRGRHTKRTLAEIRALLETANVDDNHEQANDLLNLIGKNRYLAAA